MIKSPKAVSPERQFRQACKAIGLRSQLIDGEIELLMNIGVLQEMSIHQNFGSLPKPSDPTFGFEARDRVIDHLGYLEELAKVAAAGFRTMIDQAQKVDVRGADAGNRASTDAGGGEVQEAKDGVHESEMD